jgi:hypothetical protein
MSVFDACKDNRENVRDAASQVINACIAHISERQKRKGNVREQLKKGEESKGQSK